MSPSKVLAEPILDGTMDDLAAEFRISENGFLPAQLPLAALPDPYYQPWERLVSQLASHIQDNTLRDEVVRLPVLSTTRLASEPEVQRAYSILTFLAHGYIWGGSKPAEVLPPCITVPLLDVSAQLELPPVATYASLNLWNWAYHDAGDGGGAGAAPPTPCDLDRLYAPLTFTGTVSESWFYVVSAAMEAEGGRSGMMPAVLRALRLIRDGRNGHNDHDEEAYAATEDALAAVTACIRRLSALLARMSEHCDPDTFYHGVRPFLAGSLGMAAAGLPRGVFYDEGDGKGAWRQLRGGSNGQSSLIQFIDRALGVDHRGQPHEACAVNTSTTKAAPGFHEEVLDYMPGPHRRLLQAVRDAGSLRAFALASSSSGDDSAPQRRCREAYRSAVDAMTALRNGHLQIVARYIVLPSRRPREPAVAAAATEQRTNLASVSTASDAEALTGTGGTALMSFLRTARDCTAAAAAAGGERIIIP